MTERPKIPYDPQPNHPGSDAKRDVRDLAEAGKLTSPGKRIPLLRTASPSGRVNEPPDQPA